MDWQLSVQERLVWCWSYAAGTWRRTPREFMRPETVLGSRLVLLFFIIFFTSFRINCGICSEYKILDNFLIVDWQWYQKYSKPTVSTIFQLSSSASFYCNTCFIATTLILNGTFVSQPTQASLLQFIKDATNGLCFVHQQGLVHLDVKPSNILVCSDSYIYMFFLIISMCVLYMPGENIINTCS